jgi:methyl-accepting chemotaxis protein
VRELAQRSAKAAKEIKTLINTSGDQVRAGVALVNETGAALSSIVGQVGAIDTNVRAIVDGAREQASGLAEINAAVTDIDHGTQQNAAVVEEASAASHALATELGSLLDQLHKLDIGEAPASAARVPERPAAGAPARHPTNVVHAEFGARP